MTATRPVALRVGLSALLATTMVAGLNASDDGAGASPAVSERHQSASLGPMAEARRSGVRVEDVRRRTETTNVFANPDGSWTAEMASQPVQMETAPDQWQTIDPTLQTGASGGLQTANTIGDLRLSGGGDRSFATISIDGQTSSWRWPTILPTPEVNGRVATYRDAVDGGDLVVTATATGFRHDIVLRQEPSDPVSFTVPVAAADASVRENADGSLVLESAEGKDILSAPQPVMYDASRDAYGSPGDIVPVDVRVDGSSTNDRVTLRPDFEYLRDPDTQYPVTIDPTWSATPYGDTWIAKTTPTTAYGGNQELRVGTYDGGTHVTRSFLKFSTSSSGGRDQWIGKQIIDASLTLRNFDTNTCTGGPVRVNRVTESWSTTSTTWNDQPSATSAGESDTSIAKGKDGCASGDVTWSMKEIVQAWAAGSANYGIRVKGVDETRNNTWRRYRSANAPDYKPRLSVTYNNFPNIPTDLSASSTVSGHTSTSTPTLSARVSDIDTGSVSAHFQIVENGVVKWAGNGSAVSSYELSRVVVPAGVLLDGRNYEFRAYASDGLALSGKDATAGGYISQTTRVDSSRNSSPQVPTDLNIMSPSLAPVLAATVQGQDLSGMLRATYEVRDAQGVQRLRGSSEFVPTGEVAVVELVGLTPGAYSVRVWSDNGSKLSASYAELADFVVGPASPEPETQQPGVADLTPPTQEIANAATTATFAPTLPSGATFGSRDSEGAIPVLDSAGAIVGRFYGVGMDSNQAPVSVTIAVQGNRIVASISTTPLAGEYPIRVGVIFDPATA